MTSRLSVLPWVLAAAGAFAFSVLVVFATPDGEVSAWGLLAFALSLLLVVGLAYKPARPGPLERYHRRRDHLAGSRRSARLPG